MSVPTDPIADFLSRLRNANRALKPELKVPYSKIKAEIARILQQEGYISGFELDTSEQFPQINIKTKLLNRNSAITNLKRVSRPGLRRYVGAKEVPRVLGGMGVAIVSTSQGIMSGREARRQNLGGELLAYVW